ncbi:hypothetical protein ACFL45_03200 [Candidatus Neomarinimicrobiota bacterium]
MTGIEGLVSHSSCRKSVLSISQLRRNNGHQVAQRLELDLPEELVIYAMEM